MLCSWLALGKKKGFCNYRFDVVCVGYLDYVMIEWPYVGEECLVAW
jgi:hypothetical protein